ncbi:hypothetical protein ABT272_43600, partial [Streptomyces sp900105245]
AGNLKNLLPPHTPTPTPPLSNPYPKQQKLVKYQVSERHTPPERQDQATETMPQPETIQWILGVEVGVLRGRQGNG